MLSKALISPVHQEKPSSVGFHVPFNPNEITIQEACANIRSDASDQKPKEKDHDSTRLTLSCTLFFNTYTTLSQSTYEDVRGYVRKLYPYTNAGADKEQDLKKIAFTWGSICVVGILKSLQVKYTMFSPGGIPIRCEASISIEGTYYGEKEGNIITQAQQQIQGHISFLDTIAGYHDSKDWKAAAKKRKLGKVRLR